VLCPGDFEKCLIPVDADYVSVRSNSFRNPRSNCAGSTADIKHAEPWAKEFGKTAVIPLKGSSPEYPRIGPM
jgi:hypothetical protein